MYHKIIVVTFLLYGCAERVTLNFGENKIKEIKTASIPTILITPENAKNKSTEKLDNSKKEDSKLTQEESVLIENKQTKNNLTREQILQKLTQPVFFEYDKFEIIKNQVDQLINLSKFLQKPMNLKLNIKIEGHCDDRGTRDYNFALGSKRAYEVKKVLIKSGLSENRIKTISYGKERPAYLGKDMKSRSKNRRADLILQPIFN